MDRILRNLMAETVEGDIGKLMKVCLNSIPNEVSFIDGAIVISAMSKIGLIDNFHNIEDDTFRVTRCDDNVYAMKRIPGNTCIFTTNNDGRIISLNLENCWGTDNKGYVLPAIISSLEKMTELRLGICRSLPLELSNMPQLKTLRFFDSRILLSDFPGQLKTTRIQTIAISHMDNTTTAEFRRTWIQKSEKE